jgi:SAM-dependent methyltransferase
VIVPTTDQAAAAGRGSLGSSDFGAHYYAHDCGRPYQRDDHWLTFFQQIAGEIVARLGPSTALDAGCAMGFLVENLYKLGVDAYGVDVSEYAIDNVDESIRDRCWQASLVEPLTKRYDLVTCIEVVEHLTAADGDRAIENICAATDRVLFSSSSADYREPTHVNVRPPEDWSAAFAMHGFVRNLDFDATFLTPWAVLYERSAEALPDVVRRYDRAVVRLAEEVSQVRASILDLQDRLADAERSAGGEIPTKHLERLVAEGEAELARRDRAIGLETQLGEALGRVQELESEVARMAGGQQYLERVLESTTWRIAWRVMAPYRRLRGGRS